MASTVLTHDLDAWSASPLGDAAGWPTAFRNAAQLCLAYPTPCCVLCGDRSRFLYNDAMAAGIGPNRHPAAMGQPLYDVFPYLWRTVGPVVHEVMRTGRPFTASRWPIQTDLGDGVGQYFIDVTFVPIMEGDRVRGVFAPVGNNTATHLDSQHHEAIASVASVPSGPSPTEVASQVARLLTVPDDVRFAVLFRRDPATRALTRVATGGASLWPAATRAALDVAVSSGALPLDEVLAEQGAPRRVNGPVVGARASRPAWQEAWLVALTPPAEGVLMLGLDARFAVSTAPQDRVGRLAAAASERLGR